MDFNAFYKVSYGLYLVCAGDENIHNGYVGNTVFQVTANPPQLAISCSKDNYTIDLLEKYGVFSVSVLSQNASAEIVGEFGYTSGKKHDKFKGVDYQFGKHTSVPIVLTDAVAWFECKVTQKIDVGSHVIFIGEVLDNAMLKENDDPLTYDYYRKVKKGAAPRNAPTYIDKAKLETSVSESEDGESNQCLICGYIYDPAVGDPDGGIPPGTPFEDIPDDWTCPTCGATKDMFQPI